MNQQTLEDLMKAIIIGAGGSIYDHDHLNILAKSNFDGYVLPTDRILEYVLGKGVTPEKFSRYYTATITDLVGIEGNWYLMDKFFNNHMVRKHAKNIKIFISTDVHPKQREYLTKLGIEIGAYYRRHGRLVKYEIPDKSDHLELEDCGNVSIALWSIAREYLHCSEIALLGVDLMSSKQDIELYNPIQPPTWDSELSSTLKLLSSSGVSTYNCTQGGRVYGSGIIDSTLTDFLNL